MNFLAECVTTQTEEDFWMVGFADHEFETTQYLILQRAFEFDEQDVEQDMNTYYFEIGDQACSSYGGIKEFKLYSSMVQIKLEAQTAASLKIEKVLEIKFDLEQHAWNALKIFLENIFLDTNVLEIKI